MKHDKYLDPARPVRRWITFGLVLSGALSGALLGLAMTSLGKIVTGAPPADAANYVRNMIAFAAMGAMMTPLVTWTTMRRVPLWRAVAEPVMGGVAGAAVAASLGFGVGILLLPPLGMLAAVARLHYRHSPPFSGPSSSPSVGA